MGVKVEMRGLERMLSSNVGNTMARETVTALIARGLNIVKPLAQATSPELGQSIRFDIHALEDGVVQGEIATNLDFAPYVEFGTGRPGENGEVKNGEERNPEADGFTFTLQTYQYRFAPGGELEIVPAPGWVFYNAMFGVFRHTLGQPASPYMYPTQLQLENEAAQIAGLVVRDNIRKA